MTSPDFVDDKFYAQEIVRAIALHNIPEDEAIAELTIMRSRYRTALRDEHTACVAYAEWVKSRYCTNDLNALLEKHPYYTDMVFKRLGIKWLKDTKQAAERLIQKNQLEKKTL